MTRWYQEKKREHYYRAAKAAGYRARSAYKLQQIQQRFSLIAAGDTVLDLGAAPGGWSQVAGELVGDNGCVIAVDLSPIKPLPHVTIITGDMTAPQTLQEVLTALAGAPVDVVISDMSPDITGHYTVDQARSFFLSERALEVAAQVLKKGGHFACKLFEGEDSPAFIKKVRSTFRQVKVYSPQASRKSSSEVYIVAKGFVPKPSVSPL
jgi:23S rRNA (uridine2552-2'-O)-methyltransferase